VKRVEDDFEEQWVLETRAREHAIKLATLEGDYYTQMTRRTEAEQGFKKAKLPAPAPPDPLQIEINRMLQKLNTRAAKQDALEKWRDERRSEIKAKKLPASDEATKLKDLDDQVKYAKAHL
jgi:hypothetical protein